MTPKTLCYLIINRPAREGSCRCYRNRIANPIYDHNKRRNRIANPIYNLNKRKNRISNPIYDLNEDRNRISNPDSDNLQLDSGHSTLPSSNTS